MAKISVGKYKYTVKSYHTDARKYLRIPALLSFLQESAWLHAATNEFGFNDLMVNNCTWALIRMSVKIHKMPKWTEEVYLETWNTAPDALMAYRDFELFNSQGELLVSACSTWLIINYSTRKPQRMVSNSFPLVIERKALGYLPEKLASCNLDFGPQLYFDVPYSAIDINQHVNNAQYVSWMLDALPKMVLQNDHITSFEINFLQEAMWGSSICAQACKIADQKYALRVLRADGKELVRMELVLQ